MVITLYNRGYNRFGDELTAVLVEPIKFTVAELKSKYSFKAVVFVILQAVSNGEEPRTNMACILKILSLA